MCPNYVYVLLVTSPQYTRAASVMVIVPCVCVCVGGGSLAAEWYSL